MPRSTSRGKKGSPARGKSPARWRAGRKTKAEDKKPPPPMEFNEGDAVMARWPGTNLFFRAKVAFVRDNDGEYDVQYEDGTVYTIKAKDVKKSLRAPARKRTTPSRSRSRGRSPARKKSPARRTTPKTKEEIVVLESPPVKNKASTSAAISSKQSSSNATTTVTTSTTMTSKRASARLAAKLTEMSSDDEKQTKLSSLTRPKPKEKKGFFDGYDFQWLSCLFFMVFGIVTVVSVVILCNTASCKLAVPVLPKTLKGYWDKTAFGLVVIFAFTICILSRIPIGTKAKAISGHEVRMNGFFTLLACLAIMPILVYRKISLNLVADKYFYLMISSLILSVIRSLISFIVSSRWRKKINMNPKGNTGNFIVDFFNGKEFNPWFLGWDMKLQTFRFSMISLAMLNACLVVNSIIKNNGTTPNPVVIMASAFQIIYALDALFFEEFYFCSHDAMNTGYGYSLISAYHSFPFLPTLVTRYLIAKPPTLPWYYLVAIGLINALGYIIFRASENQRCLFSKDPNNPALKHLATIPASSGKKILAGGWWSLVRHPNYLGEILIQWSWVLPAAFRAGLNDYLVYYLPIFATLILVFRCSQQNSRNKRKYGLAWDTYSQRVPANLIPKVY